jgi:hypothetical protein
MALYAVTGISQGLNAVEAAVQATDQALSQVGRAQVALALVAASEDYPPDQVVNGVSGLLSDTPLLGFSTPALLTREGIQQRSIAVALLVGDDVHAQADFWTGYDKDSGLCTKTMLEALPAEDPQSKGLLVIADGLHGDSSPMVEQLAATKLLIAGCLTGGDLTGERAFEIGGYQGGMNGLAAVVVSGDLKIAVGTDHGWQPIGVYARITRSKELQVRALNGRRPTDTYARYFGRTSRDWSFPPLNQLARLYPLGVEVENLEYPEQVSFHVRSPLLIEPDGSLRMNVSVPQGTTAYLLFGSSENCLQAARRATQQAVSALGGARPVLALVFADIAFKMMLQAQPGEEVAAVKSILGEAVPIIGGYTCGQIGRCPDGSAELFNQHIQIVLFGE